MFLSFLNFYNFALVPENSGLKKVRKMLRRMTTTPRQFRFFFIYANVVLLNDKRLNRSRMDKTVN
jgi:hypothetical protein